MVLGQVWNRCHRVLMVRFICTGAFVFLMSLSGIEISLAQQVQPPGVAPPLFTEADAMTSNAGQNVSAESITGGYGRGNALTQNQPTTVAPTNQFASVMQDASFDPMAPAAAGFSPSEDWFITLNTPYTYQMLDFQNRQGDKEIFLLDQSFANGGQPGVTFGAQFRASGLFASTNRADKFSYLGRFPTDFVGTSASDFRMLHANQNATVDINSVFHGYVETLFSDVFSFADHKQGSFQVRQAYMVFGDFSTSPFYAYIGKKNVSFGDMGTLSPFSQAMPWHYFAPLSEGAGLGFDNQRLNATVTVLNGSRGIRVVDSDEKGHLNNFAANLRWRSPMGSNSGIELGAGYLHGTIYNAAVPEHTDPDLFGPNNGAWDVNGKLRFGNLHLAAEYVQTVNPWPATMHDVIAYKAEGAYDHWFNGVPARGSVSWSEGIQGPPGSEFEFNQQLVLGWSLRPYPNALLTLEYVRSMGFAPLINITRVSDREVVQNSVVLGAVISL